MVHIRPNGLSPGGVVGSAKACQISTRIRHSGAGQGGRCSCTLEMRIPRAVGADGFREDLQMAGRPMAGVSKRRLAAMMVSAASVRVRMRFHFWAPEFQSTSFEEGDGLSGSRDRGGLGSRAE